MTALLAFLWLARQPGGFAAIKAGTKQQRDRLRRLAAPSRTDVAPWVRISEGRTFEVTAAGWQALNHAVGRVALEREASELEAFSG